VPIRRSVHPEYVVCLECGAKAKMLRRHLANAHNLTPADYRQRWTLPTDYPVVAPAYAARRSAFAKAAGFGRKRDAGGRASKRARKPA
jgi:predicted transcriptional regulator